MRRQQRYKGTGEEMTRGVTDFETQITISTQIITRVCVRMTVDKKILSVGLNHINHSVNICLK